MASLCYMYFTTSFLFFLIGGKSKQRKYSLAGEATQFAGILKLFQLLKKKNSVVCTKKHS